MQTAKSCLGSFVWVSLPCPCFLCMISRFPKSTELSFLHPVPPVISPCCSNVHFGTSRWSRRAPWRKLDLPPRHLNSGGLVRGRPEPLSTDALRRCVSACPWLDSSLVGSQVGISSSIPAQSSVSFSVERSSLPSGW